MYQRIKLLRLNYGYSQKQMADILGMQLTQYRRYENGERPIPFDFMVKLADFYNVTLDYLADREDAENEKNSCKRISP